MVTSPQGWPTDVRKCSVLRRNFNWNFVEQIGEYFYIILFLIRMKNPGWKSIYKSLKSNYLLAKKATGLT